MKILTVDKHVERHENINHLLSVSFDAPQINILPNLAQYSGELGENDLVLVHVGNSSDYNIIFKERLSCIVIYYTGQFDEVDVQGNIIYSPYDELDEAIRESVKLL